MKYSRRLWGALLAATAVVAAYGQDDVDYARYPDYSPRVKADYSLLCPKATTQGARPDHVNNADSIYFPPVINQAGGSCGSASRIAYMFTYEINRLRGLDGSLDENRYPTHFTWLLTNSNSGKDAMARANGIPNMVTYGGPLYSYVFGNQDCADADFGWMQGYDKWYAAMFNRLDHTANFPLSVETEEGREAVKNWLWNHNGDANYPGGGVCGIGVASAGTWLRIPQTDANDAAGVTNKYYVGAWGSQVDHALTIVGYDDRVEFDLDGNGIAGEVDKDEVGAWIIVNSWGRWCNDGFIYCPYKNATTTATSGSYYAPEVYYIRRDYRPLRVMKILMDYTKRSELKLSAGIATDLSATEPEETVEFEHFKYAGDGDGDGVDAETPMLGRWADGVHSEPMELGYDLTDLSAGFDTRRPLKYFFIIESKSTASGSGHVRQCSLIDYEFDRAGIEVPFDLSGDGVEIAVNGKKTIIAVTVAGEAFNAPLNVESHDGLLTWQRPVASSYSLLRYHVYRGDVLEAAVPVEATSYTLQQPEASYHLTAVYALKSDTTVESASVSPSSNTFYGAVPTSNYFRQISNGGFTVKDLLTESRPQMTIEYWMKPTTCINWNQQIGPGWSNRFMIHSTSDRQLVAGWSTSERLTSAANTFTVGKWSHVAIVVDGTTMTAYVNGEKVGTATSQSTVGVPALGDLTFGTAGTTSGLNGGFDEVRIWSTARSQREIRSMMYTEVADAAHTPGLLVELKFSEVSSAGYTNATGLYEVTKLTGGTSSRTAKHDLFSSGSALTAAFSLPEGPLYTGIRYTPVSQAPYSVIDTQWTLREGADSTVYHLTTPDLLFTTAGEKSLTLAVTGPDSTVVDTTQTFTVLPRPLPSPQFDVAATVPNGTRTSFINRTEPTDGCSFHWLMPGGDTEEATTVNAATRYSRPGTYTVTLEVTTDGGTARTTRQIRVTPVAPEAAFTATPEVAIKGTTVRLVDESTYVPTSWAWTVKNDAHHYVYQDAQPELTLSDPGIYTVTLDVSNEAGFSTTTKTHAITVCNADGDTGLSFTGGEMVTFKNPINLNASGGAYTIDWWMYGKPLTRTANHIGGEAANLMITTTSDHALCLTMGKVTYQTEAGVVTPSEWHHYAVAFGNGDAVIYKDAAVVASFRTPWMDGLYPSMPAYFCLGGPDGDMRAVIDELRMWNSTLTADEIRQYANAPIDNVADAESSHGLALYYQFNQTEGDIIDATSNANTGVRSGFGPEGDAWVSSLGIFCLSNAQREDLTADYLTNYRAPFLHTDNTVSVSPATTHLLELLTDDETSRWHVTDAVEAASGTLTGVCVDTKNEEQLTLMTKMYDFEASVADHRLSQTVTLPAGHYVFGFERGDSESDADSYLVVARGDTLLSTAHLSEAIATAPLDASEVDFDLYEETTVTLGILFNTRGQLQQLFRRFYLEKKITNDDFTWTVGIDGTTTPVGAVQLTPVAGGLVITAGRPVSVTVVNTAGLPVFHNVVNGTRRLALPAGVYIAAGRKVVVTD